MMKMRFLIVLLMIFSQRVWSERVVVVVNEANQQPINIEMIKMIYSDKLSFWQNGEEILLFELPVKSNTREKFAQSILNKSAIASQRDWSSRFISNTIKNDVKVKPQRLVARFVALKESAIGYIPESELENLSGLKVVMTIE